MDIDLIHMLNENFRHTLFIFVFVLLIKYRMNGGKRQSAMYFTFAAIRGGLKCFFITAQWMTIYID